MRNICKNVIPERPERLIGNGAFTRFILFIHVRGKGRKTTKKTKNEICSAAVIPITFGSNDSSSVRQTVLQPCRVDRRVIFERLDTRILREAIFACAGPG